MSIFGDIVKSVAGPLVGGLFGKAAADDRSANEAALAREQQDRNIELQREFAQHGIRWRVEDAKAAGLHPLYAIGGSGASFAPNPVVVGSSAAPQIMAEMGQNVTRAAMAALDPHERAMKDAQLDVLKAAAAKDYALASAAASQARLGSGASQPSTPIPLRVAPTIGDELDVGYWARGRAEDPQHQVDTVRYKPDDVTSVNAVRPYETAGGGRAFYSEHVFPGGFRMMLPAGSSPSEAVEALGESPLTALMVIQHNMKHYGAGWGRELAKQFPGLSQLVEAGEELAPVLEGVSRAWNRARMPAAVPEFSDTKRPTWYRADPYKGGTFNYRRR